MQSDFFPFPCLFTASSERIKAPLFPPVSLQSWGCDASACKTSNVTYRFAARQPGERKRLPNRCRKPALFAFPSLPRAEKWERFRSDGGAKMIVFSDVLWPRRSPRWRWQRHSGIGCGRAWQASKASVLFLPGRPGTASQAAVLQQPPN